MCDTIVALGNSTIDGSVIFGKNSDREPNEAHEIVIIPAAKHASGSRVKCTYIEIPQVPETFRVLLAKPFWIWGAEMGSNEHGVTIGNEAVFTKTPYGKQPGLIGMDLLRLALERSISATGALEQIVDLLEEYGQSGNCGFAHSLYYHNSFLICDAQEAWVLETSGKDWAAEKVTNVRSISNAITIGSKWDRASRTLVSNAMEKGWCKKEEDFNFADCYSEPIYTTFSDARRRQVCTAAALISQKGRIDPKMMMDFLRNHAGDHDLEWTPARGITGADVCMHAGWGPIRGSQTTGSMVSVLKKGEQPVHWLTGTAAPCTSIFKPVWLDTGVPGMGTPPTGTYDQGAFYWRHESLHRAILRDYSLRIKLLKTDQTRLENEFLQQVEATSSASADIRFDLTRSAFNRAMELEENLLQKINTLPVKKRISLLHRLAWNQFNKEAKMG